MLRLLGQVSKRAVTINLTMNIETHISLANHSTMRLGGTADYLLKVTEASMIPEAITWAKEHNLPTIMIGDGSNIIWGDEGYSGLVLVNQISGFEIQKVDQKAAYFKIGAGENWDKVVEKSVDRGYSGIEFLSLIPGTAGATPIQNVGAYGREIKDVLIELEAYDSLTNKFVKLTNDECSFDYRMSRFKNPDTDKGRFFISSITLSLTKAHPQKPFYSVLQNYLNEKNISEYTPAEIRKAVIAIRSNKLPNPKEVANCGSFFFNPIITMEKFVQLQSTYPAIPNWPSEENKVKISAAWLLEQAGFKNYQDKETGIKTWPKQPLVLVNISAKDTSSLLKFRTKIIDKVYDKFGIELKQEPEFIS